MKPLSSFALASPNSAFATPWLDMGRRRRVLQRDRLNLEQSLGCGLERRVPAWFGFALDPLLYGHISIEFLLS